MITNTTGKCINNRILFLRFLKAEKSSMGGRLCFQLVPYSSVLLRQQPLCPHMIMHKGKRSWSSTNPSPPDVKCLSKKSFCLIELQRVISFNMNFGGDTHSNFTSWVTIIIFLIFLNICLLSIFIWKLNIIFYTTFMFPFFDQCKLFYACGVRSFKFWQFYIFVSSLSQYFIIPTP